MLLTQMPDTELLEHLCENNKDIPHLEQYWRAQEQATSSKKRKTVIKGRLEFPIRSTVHGENRTESIGV